MLLATLLPISVPLPAAAADIGARIAGLAQPPPATTAFHERRESPLLATALAFSGELQRPVAGELLKVVSWPYVERTQIAGGRVTVEREGQPRRRFSLSRAPELQALTASFEAILSGDLALLQKHYRLQMDGVESSWRLVLTPLDARLARRVKALTLHASGTQLRCIDLSLAGDESSRMWLGEIASAAQASDDPAQRDALCAPAANGVDAAR